MIFLILTLILSFACGGTNTSLPRANSANIAYPEPNAESDLRQITGRSLLIRNVTLRLPNGSARDNMDIKVELGKITEIGQGLAKGELPELYANGLIAMPGLITSHVHLQSVPGSILRHDSLDDIHAQQALQLRAYLACGFTSVLDPAIGASTIRRLRKYVEITNAGPEIFVLAPFLTPSDGYMTTKEMRGVAFRDFWPPVTETTDLEAMMRSAQDFQAVGTKVAIEDGVVFPNLPLFSDDMMVRIRDASKATRTKLFVHSMTNKEHRLALELDPFALVHIGLWDEAIADDVLAKIKKDNVYVITTAALQKISNWGWHPNFSTDDWMRARVPSIQWEGALHSDSAQQLSALTSEIMRPVYVPGFLARMTSSWFIPSPEEAAIASRSSAMAIKTLSEHNVPWVVGADEGNSPAYTTFFHGVSSQIELEVLEEVGIPTSDIIAAATTVPAKMLGVSERLGSIEVGKQADLILLTEDPYEVGVRAFRSLKWTVARGEARTPSAWLKRQR